LRSELRRAVCCWLLLGALAVRAEPQRIIAFADVHGASEELTQLLRAVGVVDAGLHWSGGAAQVVSLGDLLDRGAGSRAAMDLLMRLQGEAAAAGGAVHVVLGNHEAMNLIGDLHDTTAAEIASYGGLSGHRAAFSSDGKYGRWLLSLPVAIAIGDTLFMHGGPSRLLAHLSVAEINRKYHAALTEYLSAYAVLQRAGLVRSDDPFDERAERARRRLVADFNADAVRRFEIAERDPMLDLDGPNWYRGAALCNEASESDVLKPILARLGVERLVVGHSVTRDRLVHSRFDGAVIKLDTGMNRAVYRGHPAALVIEEGRVRAVYADEAATAVTTEPLAIDALQPSVPIAEGANKELAAYRLDRALRLGLVPPTVEHDGGVLQARPARSFTQADARRFDGWCALEPQIQLKRVFDALIGNEPDRYLFDGDWMLVSIGHQRAFGTNTQVGVHAGPEMRRRLAALDVASVVGDLLTDRERAAVIARRDALLR
jgi:hypothetical protein